METQTQTPSIFICYAHKDNQSKEGKERWLDRLKEKLGPLEHQGQASIWSDKKIEMGQNWQEEIYTALSQVDAAVLLVSSAFLDSKYILTTELPTLLKKAQGKGIPLIPIFLNRCLINTEIKYPDPKTGPHSLSLNEIQGGNSPDKPLIGADTAEQDKVLFEVAQKLQLIVLKSQEKKKSDELEEIQEKILKIDSSSVENVSGLHNNKIHYNLNQKSINECRKLRERYEELNNWKDQHNHWQSVCTEVINLQIKNQEVRSSSISDTFRTFRVTWIKTRTQTASSIYTFLDFFRKTIRIEQQYKETGIDKELASSAKEVADKIVKINRIFYMPRIDMIVKKIEEQYKNKFTLMETTPVSYVQQGNKILESAKEILESIAIEEDQLKENFEEFIVHLETFVNQEEDLKKKEAYIDTLINQEISLIFEGDRKGISKILEEALSTYPRPQKTTIREEKNKNLNGLELTLPLDILQNLMKSVNKILYIDDQQLKNSIKRFDELLESFEEKINNPK